MIPFLKDYMIDHPEFFTQELCAEIIATYEDPTKLIIAEGAMAHAEEEGPYGKRQCSQALMHKDRSPLMDRVWDRIWETSLAYQKQFPMIDIRREIACLFLRYTEGQDFTEHVDSLSDYPRQLSITVALNDDYEGGDFVFFNGHDVRRKMATGQALLYPACWLYPHKITPITKGVRYSMVAWLQ